ncbi:MAG: type II toxin-antitoxin system VapC family toxin [Chloroflexota bacterium]
MTAEADLDVALAGAERALIDSSTFIAYLNPHEGAHPLARHVLDRIQSAQDPLRGWYSVMSALELLVRPLRVGGQEFTFVHEFLAAFPNLTILQMDLTVALQAANIRALTNIRTPDAVIIASGILAGCDAMICNDQQWGVSMSRLFPRFRWIYLGRYIL